MADDGGERPAALEVPASLTRFKSEGESIDRSGRGVPSRASCKELVIAEGAQNRRIHGTDGNRRCLKSPG